MHEKVTVAMVKYYMYIVPFCSPSEMVWYFFSAYIINNNYIWKVTQFWLAESNAVKCNTSAKSVTPVQIRHHNSGLLLAERQWEIVQANAIMWNDEGTFGKKIWKQFSWMRKTASRKFVPHFLHTNFWCLHHK